MSRLIIRRISHLAAFDAAGTELTGCDLVAEDGVISAVGPGAAAGMSAGHGDSVVDGDGLVVLPGLINAHQHLYQGAFRAVPHLERALIGPWLAGLGALTRERFREGRFGPEVVEAVASAVLAESLLGGVTTVADQHYFHPRGMTLPFVEATIQAAARLGVRLHAARGTLTLGPVPEILQDVAEVMRHCDQLITRFHDPAPFSRLRVALAPCGVHADVPELFQEMAALAASRPEVRLHTHLYEAVDTAACRERYRCTPWEFLVEHDWAGPRTWLAHVCDVPIPELAGMARAGVSVAHLVAPDLRMGWGLAPLRAMWDAGLTVGFGTTGSASNDGANLLGDLRLAALAHRTTEPDRPDRWPSVRELLGAATRGSADCLGRPELGSLAVGSAADVAGWDMRTVDRVGVHDPVAGLLLTGLGSRASLVAVGGKVLVERGQPQGFDPDLIAARAREALGA
jgi:8-oxoguanine deaminase